MKKLPLFKEINVCAACGRVRDKTFAAVFVAECLGDAAYMNITCPRCLFRWREKPLYMKEESGGKDD